MLFIIDSNEFIFAFGSEEHPARNVINDLCAKHSPHSVRIPRTVFEEIRRNLSIEEFRTFIELLISIDIAIDEDIVVPFELGLKYESLGLKPSDAFIAAYAEWTGADMLITENRHFLSRQSNLPFKVVNAEKCLQLIKSLS
ncbi:MAG: PIN domain-containing protein [Candidatus Omnitrophota bacterium]